MSAFWNPLILNTSPKRAACTCLLVMLQEATSRVESPGAHKEPPGAMVLDPVSFQQQRCQPTAALQVIRSVQRSLDEPPNDSEVIITMVIVIICAMIMVALIMSHDQATIYELFFPSYWPSIIRQCTFFWWIQSNYVCILIVLWRVGTLQHDSTAQCRDCTPSQAGPVPHAPVLSPNTYISYII